MLLAKKAGAHLDRALKGRDITLPTEAPTVKARPSPAVRCESWTIKKAECRRTDAFELWSLEKTLESPLDSNGDQTSQS